jgi:hypothetical protein
MSCMYLRFLYIPHYRWWKELYDHGCSDERAQGSVAKPWRCHALSHPESLLEGCESVEYNERASFKLVTTSPLVSLVVTHMTSPLQLYRTDTEIPTGTKYWACRVLRNSSYLHSC